ncbi:MAG: aromatic ring-hydroxylating dioxygenase subunit alpha [Atopobiaceae bacterium]|nr:aromatic ring-hydroxylating dioxygenase subunit alpha [Atopobiaceae bacterium]
MINNQWYAILSSREVPRGRPVGVTRLSRRLALWRDATGAPHCIADVCCHRGASLALGRVEGDHLACPFHGFAYDASGRVVSIPANGAHAPVPPNFRVASYPCRDEHGLIWVWNGEQGEGLPDIPFFDELDSGFSYGELSEVWDVHYTRAIENQLDVVHVPFVHATTIGRGGKSLVNGPVVRWEGTRMTYYVDNVADEGQAPLRPDEVENPERLFSLQLQMPNIWQNRISEKLRVMAAFAPIDDEHTMIYLRFYQKFMGIPVMRQAVNGLGNVANRTILHQDRRVVLTQLPKRTELRMGENLVQGDLPIIEFRRKREELMRKPARP